jgi:hypothetical protein
MNLFSSTQTKELHTSEQLEPQLYKVKWVKGKAYMSKNITLPKLLITEAELSFLEIEIEIKTDDGLITVNTRIKQNIIILLFTFIGIILLGIVLTITQTNILETVNTFPTHVKIPFYINPILIPFIFIGVLKYLCSQKAKKILNSYKKIILRLEKN